MNDDPRPGAPLSNDPEEPLDAHLAGAIAALSKEIAPPRDLWPGVTRRLRTRRLRRVRVAFAVAATLVVAVAGAWIWAGRAPEPPAVVATPSLPEGPRLAAYTEGDRALVEIRDQLVREIEAKQDRLPAETRALVFENLRTIDRALAEIEAALETSPGNAELGRTYIAYRERQIGLLRQANRVASRL